MSCELVPARLTHVGPIATKMRGADRRECEALGRTPKDALRGGIRASLDAATVLLDDRPIAMLGVVPTVLIGGKATVWMLGTDDIYRQGRALLSLAPPRFDEWLGMFTRLENIVMFENRRAIRLIKKWGFQVGTERHVFGGEEFVHFWKLREPKFDSP